MKPNQGSRRALWFIAGCVLLVATAGEAQNVSVGVVLDMESWVGKMGLSCIHMSLSEFYEANSHYNTRIVLHPKDSAADVVGAAAAGSKSFLLRIICFNCLINTTLHLEHKFS